MSVIIISLTKECFLITLTLRIKAMEKPYFLQECSSNGKFCIPSNRVIDKKLTLGASLFGIGWGIGGLCPGPAMVLGVAGVPGIVFAWLPTCLAGSIIGEYITTLI